jgi:uncharacterized protein (DUF488 family)
MPPEFVTIGAYGWDADRFFVALQQHEVDTFCDVRARRGVRGHEYAWANSLRLQAALAAHDIRYFHFPELAPSAATRATQATADKSAHIARRKRSVLSPDFIASYRAERLAAFDSAAFVASLGPEARVVALFCVELEPAACHRSLLADRLQRDLGTAVAHIVP